jgi:phage terminase large subunit
MPVELRGAPLRLLDDIMGHSGPPTVREYLIEGPAGTGKSRGVGEVLLWIAMTYPGTRGLVLRWTRKSLTDSFLKTWEEDILPPGDPILDGASRTNRHSYKIKPPDWDGPSSEIVLGGLDEPGNLLSTDFDWIYVQQTEQIDLATWMKLRTRLRNFGHPGFKMLLLIADVNPVEPTNWLNLRAERGHMVRLVSKHEHNPKLYDRKGMPHPEGSAYIASLDAMPEGPDKDRLRWGRWSARAGLVWRAYNPSVHLIDKPHRDPSWYCGSQDWGTQHPGALQIWGVDGDNNAYRVCEWYAADRSLDWWADKVVEAYDKFQPFRAIVADPSRPDAITHMNTRLGSHIKSRSLPHIVRGADNTKTRSGTGDLSGLDLVRVRLHEKRLFLIKNALRERDEALVEAGLPWCAEMEFPQYTYELDDEGRPVGENTDKSVADHAMDCIRYAQNYIWGKDLSDVPPPKRFAPGSLGDRLRHAEVIGHA